MFVKVQDKETKKVYYFEWSTVSDEPNSQAVETDDFVELHHELRANNFKSRDEWAKGFAEDMSQLGKTNVSNPYYTRKELLECSDEYKTLKSLVEYAKANLIKY
jgi:hypothetical protein